MRRNLALVFLTLIAAVSVAAGAEEPPVPPEPGFAGVLGKPGTCVRPGVAEPVYGNDCIRLKFKYGPIVVQPGDNDTGLSFKTIEKPWYDGYMVGIAPNLVRADGSVPNIEDIHLHHATWLSSPGYGNGPFFAAGEEKTVARFPVGYGMPVRATDVWYFVHMIHNEGTQPDTLWVTYDVDYVRKDVAESAHGIKLIKPFWLDVWKNGRRASYPVFNAQRGFGQEITDPVTKQIVTVDGAQTTHAECTWPKQNCAAFDSWLETDVGQGDTGNGKGTDILATGPTYNAQDQLTNTGMAGTLIGIGGHLHPGGLRVEVDVVRCTEGDPIRPNGTITSWSGLRCPDGDDLDDIGGETSKPIFVSDAMYFTGADPADLTVGNRPVSWNFSMTVTGLPYWKVNLRPNDMLRINAVYETELANWYEGMGIAVAYVHPMQYDGIDPFDATLGTDARPASECWAAAAPSTLCLRGRVTHGPLAEADNPGGANITPWDVLPGPETDTIHMAGFKYLPGDYDLRSAGIPRVPFDKPVTFVNEDAAANIFHTATACEFPCNGTTGIAYPIADFGYGRRALGPMAFDTAELGFSPAFGPAKGQIQVPDTSAAGFRDYLEDLPGFAAGAPAWAQNAVTWSMVPSELGLEHGKTYTYFCRIHPFMRGAFTVS